MYVVGINLYKCLSEMFLKSTHNNLLLLITGFFVFLLCLVSPVWHFDHLVGEEGAGCFVFLWFATYLSSFFIGLDKSGYQVNIFLISP